MRVPQLASTSKHHLQAGRIGLEFLAEGTDTESAERPAGNPLGGNLSFDIEGLHH
jgi:hypothetical protein